MVDEIDLGTGYGFVGSRATHTSYPGLVGRILMTGCVGATATLLWQRNHMTAGGVRLGLASMVVMWASMGIVAYETLTN